MKTSLLPLLLQVAMARALFNNVVGGKRRWRWWQQEDPVE